MVFDTVPLRFPTLPTYTYSILTPKPPLPYGWRGIPGRGGGGRWGEESRVGDEGGDLRGLGVYY